MKTLFAFLCFFTSLVGAQTTRPVVITWPASTSASVTGYTIATATSAAGPFTQIGCTGTVSGSTCVSGSTSNTLNYQDAEAVGATVVYQITAVGPACTSGTTPCGKASSTSAAIQIPPMVNAPGTITIVIQ